MTPDQPSLSGPAPERQRQPCDDCGGAMVVQRRSLDPTSEDWYEDEWWCEACAARGTASWSREFGERHEEGRGCVAMIRALEELRGCS